jgi:hypothetical protein
MNVYNLKEVTATKRYNLFVVISIVIKIDRIGGSNNGDILGEAVISASPENLCQRLR